MLCDYCLNINIDELEVDIWNNGIYDPATHAKGYKHYPNFYALMEFAKRQCDLCQLILAQFERDCDYVKGRELAFNEQIYCGIRNQRYNLPVENRGGSELCVYWDWGSYNEKFAHFGLYIERSLLPCLCYNQR